MLAFVGRVPTRPTIARRFVAALVIAVAVVTVGLTASNDSPFSISVHTAFLRLGIDVVPPSVMTSYRDFEVGESRIFYSLAAIKGVGDAAVQHIIAIHRGNHYITQAKGGRRIGDPLGLLLVKSPRATCLHGTETTATCARIS